MAIRMSGGAMALLAGLAFAGLTGVVVPAHAASPSKPAISEDASAAVAQMGKSLRADQLSFQARTLRAFADPSGQQLHIGHDVKVTLHRPDRLLIDVSGDDGATKLYYDGKTVVMFGVDTKRYVSIPVPNTIQGMLQKVMGQLGVDFPLADLLTDAPDKSLLYGVTAGRVVGLATIDGVPCLHLLFTQPPGIEIELWVEKTDKALPRRLIVTYRSLPAQPSFIAEFSDWNFDVHPTDADFTFQPPAGATQVELKAHAVKAPAKP
jgi:hypothetical protein